MILVRSSNLASKSGNLSNFCLVILMNYMVLVFSMDQRQLGLMEDEIMKGAYKCFGRMHVSLLFQYQYAI